MRAASQVATPMVTTVRATATTTCHVAAAPVATRTGNRMPVIIRPETEALWLDPEVTDPERLQPLLVP